MKRFFYKIFFWDEPEKGAFLHATLALTVPWMLSAMFCFLWAPTLTLPPSKPAIWIEIVLFCSIPIVACLEIVATTVCLLRLRRMQVKNHEGTIYGKSTFLMGLLAALFFLSAIAVVWMHGNMWGKGIVPAWALTLAGYVCLGCFLGRWRGMCFKSLMTKGVTRLWRAVAVIWVVSFCMAVVAKRAANKHCVELEQRLGRPPTDEARDAWIADDCRIDVDFWRRVCEILQRRKTPETGLVEEEDSDVGYAYVDDIMKTEPSHTAKITQEQLKAYRQQLADFSELPELEKMFNGPVPQLLWNDFIKLEVGDAMRKVFKCELRRLHFALADKDMETVMAILHRMDNMLECIRQMVKHSCFSDSSFERDYIATIFDVIASWLPTDGQLLAIKEILQKREEAYRDVRDGIAYTIIRYFNYEFQEYDDDVLAGESLPMIYQLLYLIRSVDGSYWTKQTWLNQLKINVGRLLLPHVWWLAANEQRIVFKALKSFPEKVPEFNCGSFIFVMDFHYDWLDHTVYGYQTILVRNRALRCAIDAMLAYRRTGEYPATLPLMPEDPYTGKPMKYRVGDCLKYDYEKQERLTIQAIQVWSIGFNQTDDDGLNFDIPGDAQRKIGRRDDIRILIPTQKEQAPSD
ncbi:MAG: hypothetical protein IKZ84_18475 [Victivallales bacterium]|nr:hypothetical protein [Victivallales bacterium]